MIIIDASKALWPKEMNQFKEAIKGMPETDLLLYLGDNLIDGLELIDIQKLFSLDNLAAMEAFKPEKKTPVCIIFGTDSDTLESKAILKFDFNNYVYYTKPKNLLKLFEDSASAEAQIISEEASVPAKPAKVKITPNNSIFNCAVGVLSVDKESITNIETFEGDKATAITWLNKQFQINEIRSSFAGTTIFNIGYKAKEDLTDITCWKDIDQLVAEGIIKV